MNLAYTFRNQTKKWKTKKPQADACGSGACGSGAVGLASGSVQVDESGGTQNVKFNIAKLKIAYGFGVEIKFSTGKTAQKIE